MDNWLDLTTPAPLSLTALAINLLLSILLSTVLAWFYTRYGKSLSNRAKFAQTLPVLALTTVFIISVIKSSLALSLGLVGALSIVRFRTAIRDVERDPELKEQALNKTKYTPSPDLTVDHLLTTITDRVGIEAVAAAVTRPLAGLKVVCYYGCVITRPPELTGATEYEYPMEYQVCRSRRF